jgi:hypothetical protein
MDRTHKHAVNLQFFGMDTTAASLVHRLLPFGGRFANAFTLCLAAICLIWLPLAVCSYLTLSTQEASELGHRLSFFRDWNIQFAFLVSFPCLLYLTCSDHSHLVTALLIVQKDGTVQFQGDSGQVISRRWTQHFRRINLLAQWIAVVVGSVVAYFNYWVFSPKELGYWIAKNGVLLPEGYFYLLGLGLFYAVITLYVLRSIAITFLLADIVKSAQVHLLPMHPDKSAGLNPVGKLGLRNQYALMVLGINLGLAILIAGQFLQNSSGLMALIVVAAVTYCVLGPIVFVAPLLPFRNAMLATKSQLMAEVAQRLRKELQRLRGELPQGTITQEDEDLVNRLRKMGEFLEELPVWPFDAATFRKFLTAYLAPLVSTLGLPVFQVLFDYILKNYNRHFN